MVGEGEGEGEEEEALEWKEGGGERSELEHNNCGCVYNREQ